VTDVYRPAPSRRIFGLRLSALAEMGLLFALLLGVDAVFFGGTRFAGIEPHPFWIPVLLIAAQYGTGEGLIAALGASLALWLGVPAPVEAGQDRLDIAFAMAFQPALWLAAALIIGELSARRLARERRALTALSEAEDEIDALSEALDSEAQTRRRLEERVAGQLATVTGVYRAARELDGETPGEVLLGVTDLMRAVFAAEKFSVFLLNGETLEATHSEGWRSEDPYRRRLTREDPLFLAAIAREDALCVAYPDHQPILAGEGLAAVPIFDPESGRRFGLIKIERMPLADLTLASVQSLSAIGRWVGTAMARAEFVAEADSQRVRSRDRALMSGAFLSELRPFLASLAARNGFCVHIAHLRLYTGDGTLPDNITARLAEAVSASLRATDLAFEARRSGCDFAVVLPTRSEQDALAVSERLRAELEASLSDGEHPIHLAVSLEALVADEPQGFDQPHDVPDPEYSADAQWEVPV